MKRWIKFDYDDGAEVSYKINNPEPNGEITISKKWDTGCLHEQPLALLYFPSL